MPALAPILLQAAPFLASLFFGDKTGATVQKAAEIAGSVLGVDPTSPDALKAALAKADPTKLAELQTALASFAHEEAMQRLKNEDAEKQRQHDEVLKRLDDVVSARGSMVDLAKVGSKLAWGAAVVSALVVIVTGLMGWMIFKGQVPAENRDLALLFAGNMLGAFGSVIAFWIGSSAGSVHKTDTNAHLAALSSMPGRAK